MIPGFHQVTETLLGFIVGLCPIGFFISYRPGHHTLLIYTIFVIIGFGKATIEPALVRLVARPMRAIMTLVWLGSSLGWGLLASPT